MKKSVKMRYDDILTMHRPEPIGRQRMTRVSRAAQFAPFSALPGYEERIRHAKEARDYDRNRNP